ncbi:hypothetical protein SAMN06265348_10256 [Pedobacter westerhofensis]|uniref:Lipocalin-like domain-containing protein n=1 Tax=Pedobacter westerhofensis TaxID=425512 RepID=A0A521B6P5_9SPHI|nr:hypothetical protein [Pedobacter westerhofensis]SMO42746.1 hypothetical protein SAMN06265348_10256 [Pedobacter westerhofensis]
MKKILTLSISILLLLSLNSCKKKTEESSLNGSWELKRIEGIQIAGADPNFASGTGNILTFSGSNFEWYENNKLKASGTFTVQPDVMAINNSTSNYSLLFNNNKDKVYINLTGKKLIVFLGVIAADGTESHYEKVKSLPQ